MQNLCCIELDQDFYELGLVTNQTCVYLRRFFSFFLIASALMLSSKPAKSGNFCFFLRHAWQKQQI